MGRSKDAWLRDGAGDLRTAVVQDVPVKGESVKVRGLSAGYSLQAQSEAREVRIVPNGAGADTVSTIDGRKLEELQFKHGVIDPVFSDAEVKQIADNFGPAWRKIVDKIDELSDLDKEAVADTAEAFQAGGEGAQGADVGVGNGTGSAGSDLPLRDGDTAGQDDPRALHG